MAFDCELAFSRDWASPSSLNKPGGHCTSNIWSGHVVALAVMEENEENLESNCRSTMPGTCRLRAASEQQAQRKLPKPRHELLAAARFAPESGRQYKQRMRHLKLSC